MPRPRRNGWGIDVGPAVLGGLEAMRGVVIARLGVALEALDEVESLLCRPIDRLFVEGVGEVDVTPERALAGYEWPRGRAWGAAASGDQERGSQAQGQATQNNEYTGGQDTHAVW